MQKDIRVIMNVCPEDIKKDIDIVREELRAWATDMNAPSQLDDGGVLSLKTKLVNFIKFGSHNQDYNRNRAAANLGKDQMRTDQNYLRTLSSRFKQSKAANQIRLREQALKEATCAVKGKRDLVKREVTGKSKGTIKRTGKGKVA